MRVRPSPTPSRWHWRPRAGAYHRFWLAEHHNMPGIASAATCADRPRRGGNTKTIRVGAGGVMLPTTRLGDRRAVRHAGHHPWRPHRPGAGPRPGGDGAVMHALRRSMQNEDFPNDVVELLRYLGRNSPACRSPRIPVRHAGAGLDPVCRFTANQPGGGAGAYAFAAISPLAIWTRPAPLPRNVPAHRVRRKPRFMPAVNVIAADYRRRGAAPQQPADQLCPSAAGHASLLPPPVDDVLDAIPVHPAHGQCRAGGQRHQLGRDGRSGT